MAIRFLASTVTLCVTVFFSGCSSNQPSRPSSSSLPPMGIKTGNAGVDDITCQRFYPDRNGYRAFIGIELEPVEPIVIGYFYCEGKSPAEAAGVFVGDRITKVRGCPIKVSGDMKSIIMDTAPKTTVFLDIERAGKKLSIPVKTMRHLPIDSYFPSRDKYKNSCNVQ